MGPVSEAKPAMVHTATQRLRVKTSRSFVVCAGRSMKFNAIHGRSFLWRLFLVGWGGPIFPLVVVVNIVGDALGGDRESTHEQVVL